MLTLSNRRLETASFRGVSFSVSQHSVKSGRRLAEHVFPGANYNLQEDVGRLDRVFDLTAYILADTPMGDQDLPEKYRQLVAALEMPGPAELIHPWLGPLWVVARPAQIEESLDRRRQIRLRLSFVEVGDRENSDQLDTSIDDLAAGLLIDALTSMGQSLRENYNVVRLPSFVRNSLAGQIGDIGALFEGARHELQLPAGPAQSLSQAAVTLHGNGQSLVEAPDILTSQFGLGFTAMLSTPLSAALAEERLKAIFSNVAVTLAPARRTTTARLVEARNHAILGGVIRQVAVTCAVILALRSDLGDRESALFVYDALSVWLDREQRLASVRNDRPSYTQFRQLERRALPLVMRRARALAGRRTIRLPRSESSLVVAYRELGDARRGTDLAAINRVINPGFMPGHVDLILSV